MKTILSAALAVTLALTAIEAGAQSKAAERKVELAIEQQSLADALNEWAKQTGLQLVSSSSEMLNSTQAPRIKGAYTAQRALEELLKGTPLTYEWVSERAVAIREKSPVVPVALQSDGADQKQTTVPIARFSGEAWVERRLAANDQASPRRDAPARQGADPKSENIEGLEEIVVTGTHIRGAPPAGSNVIVIEREVFDHTAQATVQDVLQALPQNFHGGANEETTIGGGSTPDTSWASGINLRGLGNGSTLVLLNGRRLAPSGFDASFVDISSIPLSAVDRVEVLADGSSAVYGADAIGGVVNIILRRDFSGAETSMYGGLAADGGGRALQAAQSLGARWSTGDALLTYEIYDRAPVEARDREITRSADLRRFGGSDFRSPFANPGTIVIGADSWAIPQGQDGSSLSPSQLIVGTTNSGDPNQTLRILPEQQRQAVIGALNQQFGERVRFSATTLFSVREALSYGAGIAGTLFVPSTNPFYVNPTGGTEDIAIQYNLGRDLGPNSTDLDVKTASASAGVEYSLPGAWTASLESNYGREHIVQVTGNTPDFAALFAALADPDPATAFNPFGDGSFTNPATIEGIRGTSTYESLSLLKGATFTLSGPLGSMNSREIRAAIGADYREQSFDTSIQLAVGLNEFLRTENTRYIGAAFAEVRLPVVDSSNARPGVKRLELSAAARYERYSDSGSATTPKFGFVWAPSQAYAFRGSWGKSFRAPTLADLNEGFNFSIISATPDATGTLVPYLQWSGGNRDLHEEQATTWSFGMDLVPSAVSNLQVSLTYFNIDYTDRVLPPPSQAAFLLDPRLAAFVILDPTLAQRQEVCSRSTYFGLDPAECTDAPVAAIVDLRAQNIAEMNQSGVDLGASYSFDAFIGQVGLGFSGSYLLELEQTQLSGAPAVTLLNTPFNPMDLRLRASLDWDVRRFGASLFVNYSDSYKDLVGTPTRSIASWTTADLQLRFNGGNDAGSIWDGFSVALSVQNLFDKEPPFYNNPAGLGYDPTNAQLLGRFIAARLQKRW